MLDYAFDSRPKDADVLIFGDSSAFLGIDPRLVNQELGVKSVVLPATIGSLPVVGDKALRLYLLHNKKPRLLVLYFTPWNLDYKQTATVGLFEGEEMLLRYGNRREIGEFGRHHLGELLKFPFRFYSSFTPTAIRNSWKGEGRELTTANALGHVDYLEEHPPLASPCTVPANYLSDDRDNSVRELVHRYAPLVQVMVYIAPVPDCSNVGPLTTRDFSGLGATPPQRLPARSFSADTYYAHLRPASVATASQMLARSLALRLEHLDSVTNH